MTEWSVTERSVTETEVTELCGEVQTVPETQRYTQGETEGL
eukprot:COSAG03_NODE_5895_length_1154_cov_2.381043_2_plen_41_part_00